jgi:hypothetical protein
MALRVVEMVNDGGKPFVVLTSDLPQHNLAIVELGSAAARNEAIKFAGTQGISNARCEMSSAPYAVDLAGQLIQDPVNQKIAAYHVAVPISTGF